MSENTHFQMVRAVVATAILVFATITQYLVLSPMIFQFLDQTETVFNNQATDASALVWAPKAFDVANAAYGTLTIFAVVVELLACYLYARRTYYSSEGVYVQ
jgi:hypothetical protein